MVNFKEEYICVRIFPEHLTVDKKYFGFEIGLYIHVIDDSGHLYRFFKSDNFLATEKEYRKLKMLKIKYYLTGLFDLLV